MAGGGFSFQVRGMRELDQALRQLPGRMAKNALRSGLRAGANVIRDEARSLAPVDTGFLRKNIRVKARRGTPTELRVSIFTTGKVFYGLFLEYGTPKMAARPFMRPAFDAAAPAAVKAVAAKTRQRIKLAVAKLAIEKGKIK